MLNSPQWAENPPAATPRIYVEVRRPTKFKSSILFLGKVLWVPLHWDELHNRSRPCTGNGCNQCLQEQPFQHGYAPGVWYTKDEQGKPTGIKSVLSVTAEGFTQIREQVGDDYVRCFFSWWALKNKEGRTEHHFKFIERLQGRTSFYAFDVRPVVERMWGRQYQSTLRRLFEVPAGTGDPALDPPEVKEQVQQQLDKIANGFKPADLLPPER